MTSKPTIFTFWEPKKAVPPYIRLCLETWQRHLRGHQIKVLDYANLFEYVDPDLLDWDLLKRMPLPVQKDAIQMAVLHEQGGAFLDADTIVFEDMASLLEDLRSCDVTMFGDHLGFLVAKPQARCLALWLTEIRRKIDELRRSTIWGPLDRLLPRGMLINRFFRKAIKTHVRWHFLGNSILPIVKRQVSAHEICQRDRDQHAFLLELLHYAHVHDRTPRWKYENFWFDESLETEAALGRSQCIVGLHNSWTPDWYKRLSEAEVLAHRSLLSRTLKAALQR